MYQVIFSAQSMTELELLGLENQLLVLNRLSALDFEAMEKDPCFGKFTRDNKIYYRVRLEEFRVYFEKQEEVLNVHYILPKHTWNDFVFRFKLPFNDELAIEKDNFFWKYLDSLRK